MTEPLSCEQCDEWLPGYVLYTLASDEAVAAAEHLQTCVRCRAKLAAYEATVGRLGEAVALHAPPPELQRRVMAAVTADVTSSRSEPQGIRWWQVWRPRWALALTMANVALFLGTAWFAWQAWSNATYDRAQWLQAAHTLAAQRQALVLLTEPESRRVVFSNGGSARGTLLLRASTTQAVLIVQNLPPLSPDRVYQLWLIREGVRDDGGIFRVDNQGFGMLHIQAPYPLNAYRAAGITEEPAGGSPGPTSPRLIGGAL